MKVDINRRKFLLLIAVASSPAVLPKLVFGGEKKHATHTVEIRQFKFVPDTLKMKAGDTIIWINRDIVPHTATTLDNSWDTGQILKDESKSVTFTKETSTDYYCLYHQAMKAKLEIIVSK